MKKLLEKLKHPTEKTKHRLQGVAIGSLLGAILTLTCVGVVGCSMTQGEKQQPQNSRKAMREIAPRSAWDGSSACVYVLGCGSLNSSSHGYTEVSVRVGAGSSYMDGRIGSLDSQTSGSYWSNASSFASSNGYGIETSYSAYASSTMCKVSFSTTNANYLNGYLRITKDYNYYSSYSCTYSKTMKTADVPMSGEWIMVQFVVSPDSTSSEYDAGHTTQVVDNIFIPLGEVFTGAWLPEEETSSEVTTSESLPETTSLDQSLGFVFNDNNPFSAWAVNPLSSDPAVNYDGGAPWLLYTGKPSGSGATTAQTALSTDFAVGSFSITGNPSQTFDTIRVITLNLTTDNAFILNGSTDAVKISADQFARGAFMVSEVQYRNSQTNTGIKVYNFGLTSAKLNGQDINALTSGSWLNVGYRSILWTGGGDLTINGYKAPASWWLENNALSSASAVSTMILGNSSTGVFGLLASAFTCWGSIFGLALVPGLTIGTLLFVPLVVLVIFSIIKLLQK